MSRTFKGGFHPPEKKELSKDCAITQVFPSTKLVSIPISQGGAPNKPLVAVGDEVARGQKIAETDAFMSAPVHSSVAGKVKKIEWKTGVGNTEIQCITIEADDSGRTDFLPVVDPFSLDPKAANERVREAGITGMGGASFPTHVKLNVPPGKTIEYVLANGAECEPYLTIDERTMAETPHRVVDGLAIVMHITSAKKGIIALEDNKKHLEPVLNEAIAKSGFANIEVMVVKTKYPQGGEKMLVKSVTGREIPSGGLPADAGCCINNVGSLCAISDAFREGKPLIDRPLTISGECVENPMNIVVPIGTMVGDLIPEPIHLKPGIAKIIAGGPMMGFSMMNANFPITKNTSGVLFLPANVVSTKPQSPCLNCGFCVKTCPCQLVPVMIVKSLKAGNLTDAVTYGLRDCILCGTCSAGCPAAVQLVGYFREGKTELAKQDAAARAKAAAEKAAKEGGK
ncbi:MAG: electron transport complex subunit RsxC [Spirochaetaceae bacterium]|nr:electron transport complex subunit RsxC [Spirochaetaceae bacterium]